MPGKKKKRKSQTGFFIKWSITEVNREFLIYWYVEQYSIFFYKLVDTFEHQTTQINSAIGVIQKVHTAPKLPGEVSKRNNGFINRNDVRKKIT